MLSAIDDFTKGDLTYPLKDLPEGRHTARVKAWDVYNNVGEGSTEFIVSSNATLALAHVLNYPNPFTTHTAFQFEHNFTNQTLEVRVQIFSVAGHLVKTIHQSIDSEGYRVDNIEWDGLDEYGDRIGHGVYVYKITVRANDRQAKRNWKAIIRNWLFCDNSSRGCPWQPFHHTMRIALKKNFLFKIKLLLL